VEALVEKVCAEIMEARAEEVEPGCKECAYLRGYLHNFLLNIRVLAGHGGPV
jgi:hypothetical protein